MKWTVGLLVSVITANVARADAPNAGAQIAKVDAFVGAAVTDSPRVMPGNRMRFIELSLSTDSLHLIPSTWFTHFRIWGSAPRCLGKSVTRWLNPSAS